MTEQRKGSKPRSGSNGQTPSQPNDKIHKINQQDTVKYDTKGSLDTKRINESRDTDEKK